MAHRWRTALPALRRLAADGATTAELRASALLVRSSLAQPAASWQRARASGACAHHTAAQSAAASAARPQRCNLGFAAQAAYLRDVSSPHVGRARAEGFHTGAARLHEEKARVEEGEEPPEPPAAVSTESSSSEPLIYVGALAETVRRVKVRPAAVPASRRSPSRRHSAQLLSLTSLVLTVFGAPLLVHMSSPESVSVAVKASLTASLVGFGACSQLAL